MTVTTIPRQDDGQVEIFQALRTTPYSASWWTTEVLADIPQESVGWLTAQGWQITAVSYDTTTTPSTPTFAMTRQSLQNWIILQSLLAEYTLAYNEALEANAIRYNDIVNN